MKLKIKQLLFFATCAAIMLLSALPRAAMAQKKAPPLNPILQGYAEGGSTANWIRFRQGTSINPETIFTDLKKAFELSDDDQIKLLKTEGDDLGFKHFRYQQFYKNLKVVYGEFMVHQNKDGFVKTANGRLIAGLKLNTTSSLTESQGLDAALHFMNAKKYLWQNEAMQQELKRSTKNASATYYPKGELVFAPGNYEATYLAADYRLAWRYSIYTDDKEVIAKAVYVDANTGNILLHNDIAMNCSGGTGGSAFNGSVSFSTTVSGSNYLSHNDCQATDIYVYNCGGSSPVNTLYADADNAWTLTSQQSAVQAQYGALMTYNYYLGEHNRSSWDGTSGDLIAYNNAFAGSNNACWGCYGNNAIFYAGNTSAATDDWNTDDIMGHEFTHGVTQASANLDYNKESGALNESYSDIFGEMVESWSEGNCDYLVGADRGAIRSFITPNTYNQPEAYLGANWYNTVGCTPNSNTNDNCGVHTNSGVQNHWFYLLSEGGSGTNEFGKSYNVTGITRFKARQIAYRALTVGYETTSTDYIGARAATLLAAEDLYGQCSAEIIAVGDAWHAVNVESLSAQFQNDICGVVASGDFKQAISVLTGANGCANSIAAGANVTYYTARDRVILYPGFIAPAGSRFVAYLEPCSSTMFKGVNENAGHIVMSDAERGIHTPVAALKQPVKELLTEQNQAVSVHPNPFRTSFDLTINANQDGKAQMFVYNSLGMRVMEKSAINVSKGSNKTTFDGSRLSPGVYMIEIYLGEEKTVRKIVKL